MNEALKPFAGKYGKLDPKFKRKFKEVDLSPGGGSRQINTSHLSVKSMPMGAGATVPYDPSLEAAKAALAHRTGALYNKGGMAYMSDQDLEDLKAGAMRRR
jgi:hypothetical protein